MNTIKRYTLSVLLFFCVVPYISAQQRIDPTVEVRRDYQVKLMEIHKPKLIPTYSDSLNRFDLKFDYIIFNTPYTDLYEFTPIEVNPLKREGEPKYPILYLKLGAMYPTTPDADLYIQYGFKNGLSLYAFGNHDSFWGESNMSKLDSDNYVVKGDNKLIADRMSNRNGLGGSYVWKNGVATIGANYSSNSYKYYGLLEEHISGGNFERFKERDYMKENYMNKFNSLGINASVRSVDGTSDAFNYSVALGYNLTDQNSSLYFLPVAAELSERNISFEALLSKRFVQRHNFGVGFRMNALNYPENGHESVSYMEILPRYNYNTDRFSAQLGVKLAFTGKHSDDARYYTNKINNIFPDLNVQYELVPENLWVYAAVGGGNRLNTLNAMLLENPWISSYVNPNFTITTISAEAGFRGNISGRFSYNIYGKYEDMRSDIYYMNYLGESSAMSEYYADFTRLSAGAQLLWKSDDIEGGIDASYQSYKNDLYDMPNRPAFVFDAFVRYNWNERVIFDVKAKYHSSTNGNDSQMWSYGLQYVVPQASYSKIPAFLDLGASFTYVLNQTLSIYVEASNILNSNIQYYSRYFEPGLRIGGGIFLKL